MAAGTRGETKSKKMLELLLRVSKRVSSSLELGTVSDTILKEVRAVLNTDFSALFLLDEDTKHLILMGARGFKGNQIENLKVLGSWEGINKEIAKEAKAVIVNDISRSIAFKDKRVPFSKEKFPLGAFLAVPLKKDSRIIGVLVVSNHKKKKSRFTEDDKKLLFTLGNNVAIAIENAKLYRNMKNFLLNTVTSLVTAVDAKDPYTHGHSRRVAKYAVAIAEEMDVSSTFVEDLKLSGLMHDVGKIGISDSILGKRAMLTEKERKKMEKHPAIGSRIVRSIMCSKGVMRGIEEHHEHVDGKGYPKHLKGKDISLEGRIIAIADAFDSLTTDRPYQKAFSSKEAVLEIVRSAGTQFDPAIVKAFQRSFSRYPDLWHFK